MKKFLNDWISNEAKVTLPCVIISGIALILNLTGLLSGLPFDIAWVAIALTGIPIIAGAIVGLFRDHDVTADVLVSLAIIASVITKEWFAAGEVAVIMQIGTLLEDLTAGRARKGIESLVKLTPKMARKVENNIENLIPVEDVRVGDTLRVLAGETVPVDGVIIEGSTSIDQAVMTGESIPVDKKKGDEVISGTINQYGTFTMRAAKENRDSSLQRMITLAAEADASKAPVVSLADRWASYMVYAALGLAVLAFLITAKFMRAVTVLIVFCPCAFVLATPTAVAAAIGNLTKYGILVRTGDALERLAKVDTITFDKTGTLTYGRPQVTHIVSLDEDYSEEDVLKMAAAAEARSEHPLGRAVVEEWEARGNVPVTAESAEALAGFGIRAVYGRKTLLAGKPELFQQEGIDISAGAGYAENWYKEGATIIYISADGKAAGMLALSDTLREKSADAVSRLKAQGITPVLLTGDNASAASYISSQVGIDDVRANLLPEDKLSEIKKEADAGRKVCHVGDGVNDALALSSAWAGVAMGGVGSDIAVESSDAVLVSDDIEHIPYLMYMTKKAMEKVKQNILLSLAINFGAIILSFFGILTPITGALWHNIGSVTVVVNAALLLVKKDMR